MKKLIAASLPLLLLAACGGEAPQEEAAAAAIPDNLPAGEWEFTSMVEKLVSTDGTAPATARKEGSSETVKACLKDGKDLLSVFPAKGDNCSVTTSYTRTGRVNTAYTCTRPGRSGSLNPTANGNYTADTMDVTVVTSTIFSGNGDYDLTEKVTAKRLGDCPAA